MKAALASALAVALAAAPALANFSPTFPISNSVWPAGSEQTITWQDNGAAPHINSINSFKLELQTGTDTKQVTLAVVGTNLKGSDGSVKFTIPADIGPSGKVYFFRFTPTNGDISWTTRFTLTGGTGTFPPTVELPPGSSVSTAPGSRTSSSSSSPTPTDGSDSNKSNSNDKSKPTSSPSSTTSSASDENDKSTSTDSDKSTSTSTTKETSRPDEDSVDSSAISMLHGTEAVLSSFLLAGMGALVAALL
ncbi:Ser-Thr-rich glycosyl-phosphatidyl-inositol-anchored membrane family-domain-containing protein [Syncephalis pseudoplumigaleata]|uniref:Ser-Thr-rich glycosyl-phosphatidyl-inositol-anchored membrane family-domain-containing protein n=1 Tax=Syncephalis pseudoplumigaleata TaxID=1712513 RepID=A0A4P9YWC6_9FUNG|nr:Ser-Thr-rich glycosyl-phosphatidyl-inositol-anchored membrane family-domain-containing protein [Syncephalis pseudoplumigaleata]|eukprot:RKP24148.1 Ser-Thr-rich glycosyl-phosphatidyl-inositol-anchored membrane family-domain-containing protein [Syncephalis pseudoplumigaleata]